MKKRRRPRLQDWEKQAIADAYAAGEKVEALGSEFFVHASRVTRIAVQFGHAMRYADRPRRNQHSRIA